MTTEVAVLTVGATLIYVLLAAFTGCLLIKNGALRAVAMALWPVTVLAVLLYLPFLIWWAANEPDEEARLTEEGAAYDYHDGPI